MTAPDPARLHQSIRQLEGDGGRVDVEQRDADLAVGAVIMSQFVRSDRPNPIGHVVRLIADALATERAKHTGLIRRQDAALTAVRELADGVEDRRPKDRWVHAVNLQAALALASPDTTQEA